MVDPEELNETSREGEEALGANNSPSPVALRADRVIRVQTCGQSVRRWMGVIIGEAMLRKALGAVGKAPENFQSRDFEVLIERLSKGASAFLSRKELKEFRLDLRRAAQGEGG